MSLRFRGPRRRPTTADEAASAQEGAHHRAASEHGATLKRFVDPPRCTQTSPTRLCERQSSFDSMAGEKSLTIEEVRRPRPPPRMRALPPPKRAPLAPQNPPAPLLEAAPHTRRRATPPASGRGARPGGGLLHHHREQGQRRPQGLRRHQVPRGPPGRFRGHLRARGQIRRRHVRGHRPLQRSAKAAQGVPRRPAQGAPSPRPRSRAAARSFDRDVRRRPRRRSRRSPARARAAAARAAA